MDNTQIIEIKQLPVIVEQLQTIKKDITERTSAALDLVCTEETLSAVKKERAALTKEFTFGKISAKRSKRRLCRRMSNSRLYTRIV